MPDRLGLLYDGNGKLLEGKGPRTFSPTQDATMAFRVIVHTDKRDPDGELRPGDCLWVVPRTLDLNRASGRVMAMACLVRAGQRVGIVSKSADKGRLAQEALVLAAREAEGRG